MDSFKLLINGAFVDGASSMDVINPATEEVLAKCPRANKQQLDQAVAAAMSAFSLWSETSISVRQQALIAMANAIEAHAEELSRLLTLEQGKPLADAAAEIDGTIVWFRHFATLDVPTTTIEENETRRIEGQRRPLGVVAAITPWNFPIILMAFKIPPALLAGNTVVLKPAPTTPLSTLRFAEITKDLLPPGVLNVITDANDLGDVLTSHPDVKKISFTGSTATGKKVMQSAASALKRFTLELGGNDACILLDDIDPRQIAPTIFQHAFQNSGQVCIAIKRVYAPASIYEELCDELANLANNAVVGDGLQQGTQFGPLQNKMQYEKVQKFLDDAKENGTIIAGGNVQEGAGYFIPPTIVRDIEDGTMLVDEEQFGPILPLVEYTDPKDALARANASPFGLGSSIWSKDIDKAYDLACHMNAGTVWINNHTELNPAVPFGGAKQSGMGMELAAEGLAEFTQLHVVHVPTG